MNEPLEEWRSVPRLEGLYEASSLGRIRRTGTTRTLKQIPKTRDGRLIAMTVGPSVRGRQKSVKVHHLVLEAFVGHRPDQHDGCHNDGNPENNRLTNLRWDTKSANSRDALAHGTNFQASKTRCPQGHLLDFPNLVKHQWERRGARLCLACHRAHGLIQYRKSGSLQEVSDRYYDDIMPKENR